MHPKVPWNLDPRIGGNEGGTGNLCAKTPEEKDAPPPKRLWRGPKKQKPCHGPKEHHKPVPDTPGGGIGRGLGSFFKRASSHGSRPVNSEKSFRYWSAMEAILKDAPRLAHSRPMASKSFSGLAMTFSKASASSRSGSGER